MGKAEGEGVRGKLGLWARAVRYFRDPQVAGWRKLMALWAVLYVASPIDLIPDAIPVLGWLDDLGVLTLVAGFFVREIHRHGAGRPPPPPLPPAG